MPYLNTLNNMLISPNNHTQVIQIEKFKDFIDKYSKISKTHKSKKNKKDIFNTLLKNCDVPIHAIRNFSK